MSVVPPRRLTVLCAPGLTRFIEETACLLEADLLVDRCFSTEPEEIAAAIQAADIVWLEWANELAIEVTGRFADLLRDRHVVCRLHSYEVFAGLAAAVRWEVVDDLIFVGSHIREITRGLYPAIFEQVPRVHVIPNGIDVDRFPLLEPPPDRPPGKNLTFVANLSFKKGPMLLLHAFKALVDVDPEFRLFLAGEIQQPRYAFYMDHLVRRWGLQAQVRYEGWVDDIGAWLADKNLLVSTSPVESQGMGILEAAARGLKPLVHHFVGAEHVYPESWLWTSIDEFVAMATAPDREPEAYRAFVAARYGKEREMEAIREVLDGVEAGASGPVAPTPSTPQPC